MPNRHKAVTDNLYVLVNRDDVRPYINQPRKKFKRGPLLALATSIASKGQLVPIIIRELPPEEKFKYELIAGERRHRACGIAKVQIMKAIIHEVEDEKEQHLLSVMENFNRANCTTMEIARSIKKIKDDYGWSDEKIGEVYGKSDAWIYMHLFLLKLHPLAQDMVDEDDKKKKLSFTLAVEIARKIPDQEEQLKIAKKIVSGKMKSLDAKDHISKSSAKLGVVYKERQRKPDDDYQVLSGIPKRASIGLAFFTKKEQSDVSRIFKSRNSKDKEKFLADLDELANETSKLKHLVLMVD